MQGELLSESIDEEEFKEVEGCQLYTFPFALQKVAKTKTTLSTIKQGELIDLITSDETKALASDSYFKTLKANKKVFLNAK